MHEDYFEEICSKCMNNLHNSVLKLSHCAGVTAAVAGGLQSVPMTIDAVARDGRQNKKSKWDRVLVWAYSLSLFLVSCYVVTNNHFYWSMRFQVDGDHRNPLPSVGQDSLSAVGAHAAILSAANAGAGYTAFA